MAKQRAKKEGVPAKCQRGVSDPQVLLQELRDLIQSARSGVAQAVNSALLLLYWQVGQRITVPVCNSHDATAAPLERHVLATLS